METIDIDSDAFETDYDRLYSNPVSGLTVVPFAIDDWYGDYYPKTVNELGEFLTIVGTLIHEFGVASEKDPKHKNVMFGAKNILGALYSIVEAHWRDMK